MFVDLELNPTIAAAAEHTHIAEPGDEGPKLSGETRGVALVFEIACEEVDEVEALLVEAVYLALGLGAGDLAGDEAGVVDGEGVGEGALILIDSAVLISLS